MINLIRFCSGASIGLSFSLLLSWIFQRKQTTPNASGFYAFICQLQGATILLSVVSIAWIWIASMIVSYLVVVRKIPVSEIRENRRFFYLVMTFIPLTTTAIPLIMQKFQVNKLRTACALALELEWQMGFFMWHIALGIFCFVSLMSQVVVSLYQARNKPILPHQSDALRDAMAQQVTHAGYLFVFYIAVILHGVNQNLLLNWDGAMNSSYIADTMYTYCMMLSVLFPSIGTVLALIYSVSYSTCLRRTQGLKIFRHKDSTTEDPSQLRGSESINGSDTHSHFIRIETPTSVCVPQSAVSIPPGATERNNLRIANNAYTTNLLENAREILEEEELEESESEIYSTSEYSESFNR